MTICKKCGEVLDGLMAHATHTCNGTVVVYKPFTDNEMREVFMEMGMPKMVYDSFGFAQPTEMEKKIFEDNSNYIK